MGTYIYSKKKKKKKKKKKNKEKKVNLLPSKNENKSLFFAYFSCLTASVGRKLTQGDFTSSVIWIKRLEVWDEFIDRIVKIEKSLIAEFVKHKTSKRLGDGSNTVDRVQSGWGRGLIEWIHSSITLRPYKFLDRKQHPRSFQGLPR